MTDPDPLLAVEGLSIEFPSNGAAWLAVVEDVSFNVKQGEVVAIVGESGSGKTVTSLALLGLVPFRGGRVSGGLGAIRRTRGRCFERARLRRIRGARIAMIFQQPNLSLNPAYKVGNQIAESILSHEGGSRKAARARAVELLDRVGFRIPRCELTPIRIC